MAFEYNEVIDNGVKIKVVGIGGGGNNAVNRMISTKIRGVDFIAVNTDAQVLSFSSASQKLVIGEKITNGRGAGSDPEIGRRSAACGTRAATLSTMIKLTPPELASISTISKACSPLSG